MLKKNWNEYTENEKRSILFHAYIYYGKTNDILTELNEYRLLIASNPDEVLKVYIIAKYCLNIDLNIWIVMVMAIVSGIIGQFGDLSASAIKRYCKIKDFGYIMPGHGGILDRCDSIMFVAPLVYIILKVYMFM